MPPHQVVHRHGPNPRPESRLVELQAQSYDGTEYSRAERERPARLIEETAEIGDIELGRSNHKGFESAVLRAVGQDWKHSPETIRQWSANALPPPVWIVSIHSPSSTSTGGMAIASRSSSVSSPPSSELTLA